ncbi:MAG: gamma-glutamyltransferase [Gemmatimonadetes bacterium]|nr:gamma-glutamyltransferase [Gemmatimonadota bacterium]
MIEKPKESRSTVYSSSGTVATSQPLASSAGLQILQQGGNAIDAAIAAAAMLNVVEPHMTGLGGDVFALVWSSNEQDLIGIDASGKSGSLLGRTEFVKQDSGQSPQTGPKSVTVPGALSGWCALLDRFGTMSLSQVLSPAIETAKRGFPVTPIIATQWCENREFLVQDPGAQKTFLYEGQRGPKVGEWFQNPDLANTLMDIASHGSKILYGGDLGDRIVRSLEAQGGYLTLADLKEHQFEWVDPICVNFKGYDIWEIPPAGQGIAALQMLKLLEPFKLKEMGHNTTTYLHHIIEAKKLAFADLSTYVGDRNSMKVSAEQLLDDTYIANRLKLIDPQKAMRHVQPNPEMTRTETVYLATADKDGNMVSFINSIYEHFGSGIVVPNTGFALQNRGAGFTAAEGPNQAGPKKKPLHTIIPGFVTRKGEPWMAFGVMGGSMQPQGHLQLLLNILVFDMTLQQALDAPRVRHLTDSGVILEEPIDESVRAGLQDLGHQTSNDSAVGFGGGQAIMNLSRGYASGSDPRKDGVAIGY